MKRKNRNLDSALGLERPSHIVAKNGRDRAKTAVSPICPITKAPCANILVLDEQDDEVWHPPLLGPFDIVDPNDLK